MHRLVNDVEKSKPLALTRRSNDACRCSHHHADVDPDRDHAA